MPIVSQGNSVVVDVGATDGLWIKSTGNAEVIVNQVYAGTPETFNVTTDTLRVGFYGEPVTVSIRAVSGSAEYQNQQFSIQPLTSVQDGDRTDSSPLDVKLAVNGVSAYVAPIKDRFGAYYQTYGAFKIGGGGGANAAAQDRTLAATFVLRAKPARVRLHLLNANHLAPVTGVKAAISRSANAATWYAPSVGLSGFRDFVFPSNTIPAASISTPNVVPTEIVSEWLNPYAIDRTDGGAGWILMLRVYQDGANIGSRMTFTGTGSAFSFEDFEGRVGIASSAGDFVKTSVVFNDDGASAPLFWMEVDYETPIASVAIVGDSIMQGANSLPQTNSACYGAAFLALQRIHASGKPCQLFNAGWSGATTSGSGGQMNDILSGYLGQFNSYVANGARPTIAAFCPWSVNNLNPYSESAFWAMKQCVGTFISICRKNLINPVLVTPAPRNGLTEAEETARRAVVQYIKNYCSQYGLLLIDRDAVYTNYEVATGGYKMPEWSVDNIHPTYAGHLAESYEWEAKMNQVL